MLAVISPVLPTLLLSKGSKVKNRISAIFMLVVIFPVLIKLGLCKGSKVNNRISANFLLAVISPVLTTLGLCNGFKIKTTGFQPSLYASADISTPDHGNVVL